MGKFVDGLFEGVVWWLAGFNGNSILRKGGRKLVITALVISAYNYPHMSCPPLPPDLGYEKGKCTDQGVLRRLYIPVFSR